MPREQKNKFFIIPSSNRKFFDIVPKKTILSISKEIVGMKEYKNPRAKIWGLGWRLIVAAMLAIFLVSGLSPFNFSKFLFAKPEMKLKKINLYPISCESDNDHEDNNIGWWNEKGIMDKADLLPTDDLISFSDANSAIYNGGQANLYCGDFIDNYQEDVLVEEEELLATTTEMTATSTLDIASTTIECATSSLEIASSTETELASSSESEISDLIDEANSTSTENEVGDIIATSTDNGLQSIETENDLSENDIAQEEAGVDGSEADDNDQIVAELISESGPDPVVVDKTEDAEVQIAEPQTQEVEIVEAPSEPSVIESAAEVISRIWSPIKKSVGNIYNRSKVALFGSKNYAIAIANANNQKVEDLGVFQSAKLRMSMAMADKIGKDTSADDETYFTIWYSFETPAEEIVDDTSTSTLGATTTKKQWDKLLWQEAGNLDSLPTSNLTNGGYIGFDAPFITNWEEAQNIKIRIQGHSEGEASFVAYFDSIWVEAIYQSFEDRDAYEAKLARWNQMLELLSDRDTISVGEKGELKFFYKKNNYDLIDRAKNIFGFGDYWQDVNIKISVADPEGTMLDIPITTVFDDGGEFSIKLPAMEREFKPGKYKIKFLIIDSSGDTSEEITLEQGFSWGVLALNANKSIYTPDENAYLQMAVLDDYGNTICDADLIMEVTAPDGGVATISSDNGLVFKNPDCGANNVIDKPDYFANYGLGESGEYFIKLSAITNNGVKTIVDKIEVRDSVPFDIERIGPTRIYPMANYMMKMKIVANEDYQGDIVETVPEGFGILNFKFEILNQSLKIKNFKLKIEPTEQKLIIENVNIKENDEIVIEYEMDAPDIAPEFYLLGPITIGEFSETRKWQIASDAVGTKAKTVTFLAGVYTGSGTTGLNSDTNQTLSNFNFSLAEKGVSIKNAFIVFETQYESYTNNAGAYTGYSLTFDSCQESCAAAAWTGTSTSSFTDSTVLSYDESEGNQARLLLDVSSEGQLSSYTGNNVNMQGQIGFRINRGAAVNSISHAKATLVLTYTYLATSSDSFTNTVIYPLESSASGDSGSRTSAQADDCSLNNNCPLFNYKMDLPEFTAASSTRLSQWFNFYNHNYNNLASDVNVNVNIQGTDVSSAMQVNEAALSDSANIPSNFFTEVSGYTENSGQVIEYHATSSGAPTYYVIGGEVAETYIASTSATTKTRTVSFPIGVITNGRTTDTASATTDVYFPENGTATGTIKIKKAWFRIKTNDYNNVLASTTVSVKVGDEAQSADTVYEYRPAATIPNVTYNIIHVIDNSSYAELEEANADIAKTVAIYTTNSSATNIGGVSAELMITYTYTDESQGYLTNLSLFAGQSAVNGNATATTTPTANSVLPEAVGKTIIGAQLFPGYLSSDNDSSVPGNYQTADANISTSTPTCTNSYNSRTDAYNTWTDFYRNVSSAFTTTNNQAYNACYSVANAGDGTTGAKMNGILNYTYAWSNSKPTGSFNSTTTYNNASGRVDFSIEVDDPDDDDCKAKLEFATGTACDFTSATKVFINTTDASTTADFGDPKIDNVQSYQIGTTTGWAQTNSGSNSVNFTWDTKTNLPTADGAYCLRLTVNDRSIDQAIPATTTVMLDNKAPSAPGPMTLNTKAATSAILNLGATTTETNFVEYKIFYKPYDGNPVTESDSVISSSTETRLGDKFFLGESTTTIQDLSPGTKYSFAIWAYDSFGNKASSTRSDITTNNYPVASFNSAIQKTDNSGRVDISIEVDDPDNDDTLKAKLEYVENGDCDFTTPSDPTLDETQSNIQADFGTPKIYNTNDYQVGSTTGWILTSPGSNTVNFDWLTKMDLPDTEGIYCLRLTVSDGMNIQATSATTTISIDNIDPTAPGNLTKNDSSKDTITLAFGATSTDSNFSKYRIFYKAGASGVTEANTEHIDADLNNYLYNTTATTTVTGLSANTQYVFNIWAYDVSGNKASATEMTAWTDASIKNISLSFTNPVSGNIAVADGFSQANFRAVVREESGWLNIKRVILRLADNFDSVSPFNDMSFRWTRTDNAFTEIGVDNYGAASLATTSVSNCSGDTCTLDFKIIFNTNFRATSTDYSAEMYSENEALNADQDTYTDFYNVRSVKVRQTHYRWRNDDGYE